MSRIAPKDQFLASLERCIAEEEFIPAFYDRFMMSSDLVKQKFRFTNFEKQNQMLVDSLRLVASATNGDPEGLQQLAALAKSHDRDHRNILPEMYDLWLDAVVQTAGEFDNRWDEETEEAWRHTLKYAIAYMQRRY